MNPAPLCESALDASAGIEITSQDRWLVVSFARDVRACSWAIVGGGLGVTRHVVWHQVEDLELRPPVDPAGLLRERLRERDLMPAIGLLTSRSLAAYQDVSAAFGGVNARCVATVGLGNALRAGDPPGVAARIGTINLLVHVSVPLGNNALLEAMTIASEAKAIARYDDCERSKGDRRR